MQMVMPCVAGEGASCICTLDRVMVRNMVPHMSNECVKKFK